MAWWLLGALHDMLATCKNTLMGTRRKDACLIRYTNVHNKLVYLYYKNDVGRVDIQCWPKLL